MLKKIFEPLVVGDVTCSNRIFMAPLTRCRTGADRVPNDLMREYYSQRASAGLILTEATVVSPMGIGYPRTPGIFNVDQMLGWKKIVQAVHERGGKIYLQLWHVGRVSDPEYLNGKRPLAPSAMAVKGHVKLLRPERPYPIPRALALSDISKVVEEFRMGAELAQASGFDGVEIHAANGYLIDQFLQDSTNLRKDEYGGPLENRARFLLEVADAVIGVWGAGRVGVHLAPRCDSHSMGDSNPRATFGFVAEELGKRKIAFLCTRESLGTGRLSPELKRKFGGVLVANEAFSAESAESEIVSGAADAVAFGKLFIANPDLPRRFREGLALNSPVPETFYTDGPQGYTDYKFAD